MRHNPTLSGLNAACNDVMLPKSRQKSLEDDVKELQTNVADIMNAIASITNIPNIVSTSATTASNESFALLNGTNVNKLGAVSNDD